MNASKCSQTVKSGGSIPWLQTNTYLGYVYDSYAYLGNPTYLYDCNNRWLSK